MFLGRRYPADEALAMGLVHRVLEDQGLETFVDDVINTLIRERTALDRQLEDPASRNT